MKKVNYLFKMSLSVIMCLSMLTVSCKEDETIEEGSKFSAASATAVNFSSIIRTGNEYDFKYVANIPVKVDVTTYNKDYTYELKLTGQYFKKEYKVALTKTTSTLAVVGNGLLLAKRKLAEVAPKASVTKTTLTAEVQNLQMEADAYTAVLVEKESNNELSVGGVNSNPYTILDTDSPHFLSTTRVESDRYATLTELNLNTHTRFRVRPKNPGYIKGISVQLAVYDLDLNKKGVASWSGANSSTTRGRYSYIFNNGNLNALVTSTGEYLLRLEEREFDSDAADKVYKKGVFQKIKVTKLTPSVE